MYEISHFPMCFPWLWTCKANTTLVSCWVIFWICGIFPQVYSDYESNPQLRQAIEFACHQFYILHRKPFVLQLFASVAPLLEFPVSKLCANKGPTQWEKPTLFIQNSLEQRIPGLVITGCGSEFCFYGWPGHCPFLSSGSLSSLSSTYGMQIPQIISLSIRNLSFFSISLQASFSAPRM